MYPTNGVLRVSGNVSTSTGYELTIKGSGKINLMSGGSMSPVNFGQMTIDIDPTFHTYNTVSGGGTQSSPASVIGWNSTIPLINRGEINANYGYLSAGRIRNEPLAWNGTQLENVTVGPGTVNITYTPTLQKFLTPQPVAPA